MTSHFSEKANNIEDIGVSSVYDEAFEKMESSLLDMKTQLESSNLTKSDIENLQSEMENLLNKVCLFGF